MKRLQDVCSLVIGRRQAAENWPLSLHIEPIRSCACAFRDTLRYCTFIARQDAANVEIVHPILAVVRSVGSDILNRKSEQREQHRTYIARCPQA